MANLGAFDVELRSAAWFDASAVPEGWFDYGLPFSHPLVGAGGIVDAAAQVSWAELEVPSANAAAQVSWAELEVPFASAAAQVSWAELEVPTADSAAQVSWAELEVPTATAAAQV